MIPPDVASRLQVSADISLRPVAPTQEIADKLSGLTAGDRVMASIQALLPNGTYRAMINQRAITLALPFSAKLGDALELQVTESDGKLALAVVSRRDGEGGKPANESAAATLSRTGQLISNLFSGTREARNNPVSLPLNANQPIAGAPPAAAEDLLPVLKQAITQSGMFYESHQAEWVEGRFPKTALLQEPQGKLSSPMAFQEPAQPDNTAAAQRTAAGSAAAETPQMTRNSAEAPAAQQTTVSDSTKSAATAQAQTPGQIVAPQAQPIVQQQLEALATQNFVWQGQIWPGQEMRWEIEEDGKQASTGEDSAEGWRTRLHLNFPLLGEVDARIQLQGTQIVVALTADTPEALARMQAGSEALREQLNKAGLSLASLGIDKETDREMETQAHEPPEAP